MANKILVVCEHFGRKTSGGRAAVALAQGLKQIGSCVSVATFAKPSDTPGDLREEFQVSFLSQSRLISRRLHHIVLPTCANEFRAILQAVRPQVVHFASFDYAKPQHLIRFSQKCGAKVVLQPWIYSSICATGYAEREGLPCTDCFSGNFHTATKLGCSSRLQGTFCSFARHRILASALQAGICFISSCRDMDERLTQYGAKEIIRLPIPFLPGPTCKSAGEGNGAFIYYAQAKTFKGVQYLPELIRLCRKQRFEIYPIVEDEDTIAKLGLCTERLPNLKIVRGMRWDTGLEQAIRNATGCLLPTTWPTTTEYTLIEALSMGKPIFAFNVGAHKDYLIDRDNAMVGPLGDIQQMAAAVHEIHNSSALRNHIAPGARSLYDAVWAPSAWIGHLSAAYQQILSGPRIGPT